MSQKVKRLYELFLSWTTNTYLKTINIIAWPSENKKPSARPLPNPTSSTPSPMQAPPRRRYPRPVSAGDPSRPPDLQNGGRNDSLPPQLGRHHVWRTAGGGAWTFVSFWTEAVLHAVAGIGSNKMLPAETDIEIRENGENVRVYGRRPTKKRHLESICWSNIVYRFVLVKEFTLLYNTTSCITNHHQASEIIITNHFCPWVSFFTSPSTSFFLNSRIFPYVDFACVYLFIISTTSSSSKLG